MVESLSYKGIVLSNSRICGDFFKMEIVEGSWSFFNIIDLHKDWSIRYILSNCAPNVTANGLGEFYDAPLLAIEQAVSHYDFL